MSNLMMPSRVLLYGRTMKGLNIKVDVFDAGRGGAAGLGYNKFLREQFGKDDTTTGKKKPRLAMIYGFEFEGHYYDLTAPTIMLVHGRGISRNNRRRKASKASVKAARIKAADGGTATEVNQAASDAATDAGYPDAEAAVAAAAEFATGTATPNSVVAAAAAAAAAANPYVGRVESPFPGFPGNVRVWPYDKADFSMRLDPSSGPIESILLETEFEDAEMAAESSGRHVSGRHVSGRHVSGRHMSGRHVRGKKS